MQQRFLKSSLYSGTHILRSFRHASQVSSAPKPISRALSFPSSLENILRQDSILVHRQYEMLNIFLGYEQHNKYNITNAEGINLGYILEENTFWRVILRQVIGTHRPLKAVVLDPQGQVLLEVKRPWTFINSRLSVLYSDKTLIGEVHQVWHLWRRRYELFLRKKQFGNIDGGFLTWDFSILNDKEAQIALITRNFTDFIREAFTDTGQYLIRYRDPSSIIESKLSLAERAVILGCAISIDFDYFSRHSDSGWGGFFPLFVSSTEYNQSLEDSKDAVSTRAIDTKAPTMSDAYKAPSSWWFPFSWGSGSSVPSETQNSFSPSSDSNGHFDEDDNWHEETGEDNENDGF